MTKIENVRGCNPQSIGMVPWERMIHSTKRSATTVLMFFVDFGPSEWRVASALRQRDACLTFDIVALPNRRSKCLKLSFEPSLNEPFIICHTALDIHWDGGDAYNWE